MLRIYTISSMVVSAAGGPGSAGEGGVLTGRRGRGFGASRGCHASQAVLVFSFGKVFEADGLSKSL